MIYGLLAREVIFYKKVDIFYYNVLTRHYIHAIIELTKDEGGG